MRRFFIACVLCAVITTPCLSRDAKRVARQFGPHGERVGQAELGVVVRIKPSVSFTVMAEPAGERRDTHLAFRTPVAATPGVPGEQPDPEAVADINFFVTGGPGVYFASDRIVLVVSTNDGGWGILCQAAPLSGKDSEIQGAHVFARSDYTASHSPSDEGAGSGFVSLGEPRVIAAGPEGVEIEIPVDFKLLTEAADKAGNYAGTIVFSYMPAP